MNFRKGAAIVIALSAITIAAHTVQAVNEKMEPPQYESYSRVVMQGQTLWSICERIPKGRDTMQDLVERARVDNDIKDPGKLMPGKVLLIRVKK